MSTRTFQEFGLFKNSSIPQTGIVCAIDGDEKENRHLWI
jgi:hypothetical protein